MTEHNAHLFFSLLDGIGPLHFRLLIDYFGSAAKALKSRKEKLTSLGLTPAKSAHIVRFRSGWNLEKELARLEKENLWYIARSDREYPDRLRELPDSPIGLFGRGDRQKFFQFLKHPVVAVVGSRKITNYGTRAAHTLVSDLCAYDVTIISGLMYGVDEAAHRAALSAKGNTIGVWAGGIDTVFTGSRANLAQVMEKSGVIISEFPPGLTPSKGTFPARNRIVSGLSHGVLVVEGAKASGSLITARLAGEQGSEVFAVPGPIDSVQSVGPLTLIKKGAKLVTSVEDILEELPIKGRVRKGSPVASYSPKSRDEETILDLLKNEPHHVDDLIRKAKLPGATVGAVLSMLELSGVVTRQSDGSYAITK